MWRGLGSGRSGRGASTIAGMWTREAAASPPDRDRQTRITWKPWIEALLCALLLGLLALKASSTGLPGLSNDSFQYLSVADNTRAGQVARTSLLQFDEERSHGIVPAPLTTFPPGYPLLVAAASLAGVSTTMAGIGVDIAATLGSLLLLWPLGRRLGLAPGAIHCVQLFFALASTTLTYATAVLAEAPFTCMLLLALTGGVAALQAAHAGRSWRRQAVLAGLALGAAYWLRYAGLFAIVGVVGLALLTLRRRWASGPAWTVAAVALAVAALGFARNIALVGTWRGGNTMSVHHALPRLVRDFGVALKDLVLAPDALTQAWPARLLLSGLLLAAVAVATVQCVSRPRPHATVGNDQAMAAGLLASVVVAYTACLIYAAATTMITFGFRFFSPLLPALALLAAFGWQAVSVRLGTPVARRCWTALGVSFTLLLAATHATLYLARPVSDIQAAMAARLNARTGPDGRSAAELIQTLAGRDGVVVATLGQPTGQVLRLPTVSLVGPEFSATAWDEAAVRRTLQRFGSQVLVVHLRGEDGLVDEQPSPFIARLAAGQAPDWLQAALRNDRLAVYRTARPETPP